MDEAECTDSAVETECVYGRDSMRREQLRQSACVDEAECAESSWDRVRVWTRQRASQAKLAVYCCYNHTRHAAIRGVAAYLVP